jgi:hypothetical protein
MLSIIDQSRLGGAGSRKAVVVGANDVLGASDADRETKALSLIRSAASGIGATAFRSCL